MALYDHVKKEINAKLVFFGPAYSGKETSVGHVYRNINPDFRSPLKSMSLQGNRILFFDFLPPEQTIDGYSLRFHIYTVPGEVVIPSTWNMVLKGADGVVFVADSDPDRLQENEDHMKGLETCLGVDGASLDDLPLVMQYNRRDITAAVTIEELQRRLNRANVPVFTTVATTGEGVLSPLSSLIKMVMALIRERFEETTCAPEAPADATERQRMPDIPTVTDVSPPPPEQAAPVPDTDGVEPEPSVLLTEEAPVSVESIAPLAAPVEGTETEEPLASPAEAPRTEEPLAPPAAIVLELGQVEIPPGAQLRVPLTFTCGESRRECVLVISCAVEDQDG